MRLLCRNGWIKLTVFGMKELNYIQVNLKKIHRVLQELVIGYITPS